MVIIANPQEMKLYMPACSGETCSMPNDLPLLVVFAMRITGIK
jgi:hypothetical protein